MKTLIEVIYLIGLVWAYIVYRYDQVYVEKEWTLKILIRTIIIALFSWVAVIFSWLYDLNKSEFWNKKLPPWL